jgi:AraC family transcriptional regulator of adaptative response/methylated-DNA-[protein]-cysteine methyltransferase
LRAGSLRNALKQGESVTSAIYNAGFGSSSRGYDGAQLGMTPARFAKGGRGEQIGWCCARSAFGWVIVGATQRGLCWLSLAGTKHEAEASLREEFPAAVLKRDPSLAAMVEAALRTVGGQKNSSDKLAAAQMTISNATKTKRAKSEQLAPPQVDLRGTAFQLKVWQALRRIPRGETRSYSQLARELGDPKATRAVARACATNRVAIVVPCHRVVGASGSLTGYRWGIERKRQLLEAESAMR